MAGVLNNIFSIDFTSSDSIVVTHNQNRDYIGVKIISDDVSKPELITTIIPTNGNELNEMTINLSAISSGKVQLFQRDVIEGNFISSPKISVIDAHFTNIDNPHDTNIVNLTDTIITTLTSGDVLYYDGAKWVNQAISTGDELVKVSSNDTTAGYLNGKLTTALGLQLTENNDGANETLTIGGATGTITILHESHGDIPSISGNAVIPEGAATPLITQGVPIWTTTFTPLSVTSDIAVSTSLAFAVSKASATMVVTVFRDSICVGSMIDTATNNNNYQTVTFTIHDHPNTLSPITYQVRVGTSAAATWWINTNGGGDTMGGTLQKNSYIVQEKFIN